MPIRQPTDNLPKIAWLDAKLPPCNVHSAAEATGARNALNRTRPNASDGASPSPD